MKPKQARDRLFKYSRPNVRPMDLMTEQGIGPDMAVLWAAYRKGSFPDVGEMDQEEFTIKIFEFLGNFYSAWMVEDRNHLFPSDYGPVGMVVARFNGWEMEPQYIPFTWATLRNNVRSIVAFFQMARYEKGVGVLNVYSDDRRVDFYRRVGKRYGVLYYVGKIPRGDFGENKYIFYGRGGSYFKGLTHGN